MVNRIPARTFASLLCVVSLAGPAFAQTASSVATAVRTNAPLTRIKIGNFGKINDNYYRGEQPNGSDYADLAAIGVKTVIDLQIDGPSNEAGAVRKAGMQFYRIGMTTSNAPTSAQIAQFFKIVTDPANQPVYVHCAGGRHRTGTMTALYRMTYDGWNPTQAYAEMKKYRFEGFIDHPVLRNFVYAYKPAPGTDSGVVATTVVPTK
jgi:tyrosine-protein phosphatase SIW14